MRLRFSSGLKAVTVVLDGRPADLQDGGLVQDGIALSTDHHLSLFQAGQERVLSYPFARLLDLSLSEHEAPVQVSQPGFEARRHADHPKLE